MLRFELVGPHLQLHDEGSVRNDQRGDSFCLTAAVCSGGASATFRLDSKPEWAIAVGVFPGDLQLDSDYLSATGKRFALRVHAASGGEARVLCNGETRDRIGGIDWTSGDLIEVDVAFESGSTAARVTLRFKGRTESALLEGVPSCGLRFGVGMQGKGSAVTLMTGSVDDVTWCASTAEALTA